MKTSLLKHVSSDFRRPDSLVRQWTMATLAAWVVGFAAISAVNAAEEVPSAPAGRSLIRIGIAPGTWWGVNPNDAQAAISAWAKTILRQRRIEVDVETRMFDTEETMRDALKAGEIDAVSMLAGQLLELAPELQPEEVFLGTKNHSFTEQYKLLVHRAGGITNVGGVAGRKLVIHASARTSLAPQWIDTLLARNSLRPADEIVGNLTKITSPSKAVLQVFFRQAEACLVTSNVLELACELNPQLRRDLKVLAVSPEVVPSVFFFRAGYNSTARDLLEPAILALHETAAGLQVLTVFQSDGMVKRPLACLEGTRQLLAEYRRRRLPTERKETAAAGKESTP